MKPTSITIINLHLKCLVHLTGNSPEDIFSQAILNYYRESVSYLSMEDLSAFTKWCHDTCFDIDYDPIENLLVRVRAELSAENPT